MVGGANIRKEPAVPSLTHPDAVFLGMDVHRDSISVGILNPGHERPDVEKIFHDEASVRRLIDRFPDRSLLWSCYEAGPTGYDLARLLKSLGVHCEVIAPSMIPKASGDKVKTDTRDCRRLARLHRAGELVAVRIPTPFEEAVRDLCRTRGDMVEDLTRARNRLTKFLLRHSRVWRDGSNWTVKHEVWLRGLSFDEPRSRPPSTTIGPQSFRATPHWLQSRLICPTGSTRSRLPIPCGASPPIAG